MESGEYFVDRPVSMGGSAVVGSVLAATCQVFRITVQVATTAILARLLCPTDFGLVAMAGTAVAFLSLFSDLGLSTATIRREVITHEDVSSLFLVGVAGALIVAVLTVAVSPLVGWFYGDWRVTVLVAVQAAGMPVAAAGMQHFALLSRRMSWLRLHAVGVIAQVVSSCVAVWLAIALSAKYAAPVAQALAYSVVATGAYWCLCGWRPSLRLGWKTVKEDMRFGLGLTWCSVLDFFHRQFDNVLVGWRYGAAELGFYSRAFGLLSMSMNLVAGSLSQSAIPILARMEPFSDRWERAFLSLLTVCAWLAVGACATAYVAAEPIVETVFGPRWHPSSEIFRALAVASAFSAATTGCHWAFVALGKSKEMLRWALFATPIFALSFVVGLPWGPVGVAKAYSVSMSMMAPCYVVYAARVSGLKVFVIGGVVAPPLLAFATTAMLGDAAMSAVQVEGSVVKAAYGCFISASIYGSMMGVLVAFLPSYRTARVAVFSLIAVASAKYRVRARQYIGSLTAGHGKTSR